jgi:lactate 2-monooxygenase
VSEPKGPSPGLARQREIYLRGVSGDRPAVPTLGEELERRAERAMTPQAWAYISGGAGAGSTIRANRDAFERWRIVPRVLRDVSTRDLSIDLLGIVLPAPILLAPIGVLEVAHPDADLAVARAARTTGVAMIISNQASVPMEECTRELGSTPRWFQLYWSASDELVASFVRRAEACGCGAIVLTLDTTMLGWRTRDLDLAWLPFLRGMGIAQYTSDPVFRAQLDETLDAPAAKPPANLASLGVLRQLMRRGRRARLSSAQMRRAVQRFTATYSRPSLTWTDLAFLRGITTLPLVLKGIQHADDARRAVDEGVNAIVVSNHGGRQVDGGVGSLDALPGVADAVAGRIPVLFDSGVRSGADVFKALALGAAAILLGRPYAYGLAMAGEAGVREVIQNVMAELDLTLGLAGYASVRELSRDAVSRVAVP